MFSELDYLWRYPDVASAIRNGYFANGEQHFQAFGAAEGRNGEPVTFFDETYYRNANPDVDHAVASGVFPSGRAHFFSFGHLEHRPTSPQFYGELYMHMHPDVRQAVESGALQSEFQHYEIFGRAEGRLTQGITLWLGSPGNDTIGADGLLRGYGGNDVLFSNAGATMYGDEGNDRLSSTTRIGPSYTGFGHGGSGNDTISAEIMEGGEGNDVFNVGRLGWYGSTSQVIRDFEKGHDVIAVNGFDWEGLKDSISYAETGANIRLEYVSGAHVTSVSLVELLGVAPGSLSESDFFFRA